MREGPSSAVLAAAASWECTATAWLGGVVLAENIPLTGRATGDIGQKVSKRVRVTVPRFSVEDGRTVDWLPRTDDAPLAKNGQVLDITITADGVSARMGRYLITDWRAGDGTIEVDAAGMLRIPEDDRLPRPLAPRDGGTLRSEFARLLSPQLSVQFGSGLVDRECPRAMEWGEDRIGALYEIADAWPARLREDEWGQVVLLPPLPLVSNPVLSLTDGENGTVVSAPTSDTRTEGWNRVVARSSRDAVDAQGIAEITTGYRSVNGPYGVVSRSLNSPLFDSPEQCREAAAALLADSARRSRVREVTMAPDTRPDLDDPVEIITDKGTPQQVREWGYVVGYDLPLTVADGPGRLNVGTF